MTEIYSEEEIQKLLSKIRRIAKMADDDATEEIKEFAYKIYNDYKSNRNSDTLSSKDKMKQVEYEESLFLVKDNIKEIRKRMRHYEKEIISEVSAGLIKADDLEDYIKSFEEDYEPEVLDTVKSQYEEIKKESVELIRRLRTEFYLYYLDTFEDGASTPIALKSMKKAMKEIRSYFETINGFTDDIQNNIRRIMEKRALSRAEKKLLALDVAKETGDEKKIIKLRLEAEIIIKQDWIIVFNNDEYPKTF